MKELSRPEANGLRTMSERSTFIATRLVAIAFLCDGFDALRCLVYVVAIVLTCAVVFNLRDT